MKFKIIPTNKASLASGTYEEVALHSICSRLGSGRAVVCDGFGCGKKLKTTNKKT